MQFIITMLLAAFLGTEVGKHKSSVSSLNTSVNTSGKNFFRLYFDRFA